MPPRRRIGEACSLQMVARACQASATGAQRRMSCGKTALEAGGTSGGHSTAAALRPPLCGVAERRRTPSLSCSCRSLARARRWEALAARRCPFRPTCTADDHTCTGGRPHLRGALPRSMCDRTSHPPLADARPSRLRSDDAGSRSRAVPSASAHSARLKSYRPSDGVGVPLALADLFTVGCVPPRGRWLPHRSPRRALRIASQPSHEVVPPGG